MRIHTQTELSSVVELMLGQLPSVGELSSVGEHGLCNAPLFEPAMARLPPPHGASALALQLKSA